MLKGVGYYSSTAGILYYEVEAFVSDSCVPEIENVNGDASIVELVLLLVIFKMRRYGNGTRLSPM